jgi:hypothetical protein
MIDQKLLIDRCRSAIETLRISVLEAHESFELKGHIDLRDRMSCYLELIELQENVIEQLEWAVVDNDLVSFGQLVNKFNGISAFISEDSADVVLESQGLKPKVNKMDLH